MHQDTTKKYLPFSIKFDLQGKMVILDEHDTMIKPSHIEFPLETTVLNNIQTFTMTQVKGCQGHVKLAAATNNQCYTYITSGGVVYKIPIPCP